MMTNITDDELYRQLEKLIYQMNELKRQLFERQKKEWKSGKTSV